MRNLIQPLLVLLLILPFTTLHAEPITDEQLSELSDSRRQLILLSRKITSEGGQGIKAVSFAQADYKFAISSVYTRFDNDPPLHIASVVASKSGAYIGFKINEACNAKSGSDRLIDSVIRVDGQNISAKMACALSPGSTNELRVYIAATDAGRDFLYNRFSNHEFVFVDFGNGLIPFDTDGFDTVWRQASAPAL